ncbi:InterPro IPR002514 COGs COG2963 [Janthinobacterium sp. CG23_2]|nr:InterPro IPR002514 COGs COG2963 [Janthinobacterium sp. CG23_2]CUU30115.1 InterPro IPR002514 COGs COG2963 [Janthinobacterium sp. CG23_2]
MARSKAYTPELREEAVKLVLTQGLTLDDAALRLTIPKGTLANWVAAARHSTSPKVAPGSRTVPELEAEVTKLRKGSRSLPPMRKPKNFTKEVVDIT